MRVNTDATTNDQWQPGIAVTPNSQGLFVGWYDRLFVLPTRWTQRNTLPITIATTVTTTTLSRTLQSRCSLPGECVSMGPGPSPLFASSPANGMVKRP